MPSISKFAIDADVAATVTNVRVIEEKLKAATDLHDGYQVWYDLRFDNDGNLKKNQLGQTLYPMSSLYFKANDVEYPLEFPTDDARQIIESIVNAKKTELEALALSDVTGK